MMNNNENYKNSGVKWIGEIPKHWEVSKLKYISKITYGISPHQDTYNDEGDGTLLINGPAEYSKTDFGYTRPLKWTTAPKNLVPAGVLLFCLRASTGRLNITHTNLSIGRGVCSIEASMNQNFLVFCMIMIKIYIQGQMSGSIFPSVTKRDVDNFILPMPPLEEQKLIACYLDRKTGYIDSLLEKKFKKIEFLKEQRASLINQCITKGLTPKVKMKDSRVEWIGQIPKHWEISKIKYNSSVGTGSTPKSEVMSYWNGKIRWYTPTDFKSIDKRRFLRDPSQFITQEGLSNSSCSFIDKDAVLLTTRAPVGNVGKIKKNFTFNQGCKSLTPRENLDISYLYFYLKTVTEPLNVIANGTTFTELSIQNLLNFEIPLPPLEEQKLISHYLDKKTEQIDSLIEKIQKKIKLLKEYRQSLISSVVTGKIRITENMV